MLKPKKKKATGTNKRKNNARIEKEAQWMFEAV